MGRVTIITDAQRRSRIAHRHRLTPQRRVADPESVVESMTVLHATEAATVYLSLWSRLADPVLDQIDRALYRDRTLVKQLAMRRTLFVFPRDLLGAALGSASARVAAREFSRLAAEVERAGITTDGAAWLRRARDGALQRLRTAGPHSAAQLREQVPELAGRLSAGEGRSWGGQFPVAPRVITGLAAEGLLVRGENAGPWWSSRPRWEPMESWLGERPEHWSVEAGYAELVRRWLGTFGPGTETDLTWWLGATKSAVRRALADVGAEQVGLESGAVGWVLPGDTGPDPDPGPWVALLPVLDSTTMGWKERDFYLDRADAPDLFDANGNGGTTVWCQGRIAGWWVQDDSGRVRPILRHRVGRAAEQAIADEADRLSRWLAGSVIRSPYQSRQMREADQR